MTEATNLFQPAVDAGLKPRHIQRYMQVSHPTASNWFNGNAQPHNMVAGRVAVFLEVIKRATKAKDFPVPIDLKGAAQNTYVMDVLRKHTVALKKDRELTAA